MVFSTKVSQLASLLAALTALSLPGADALRVDPGVHRTLRRQGTVNLMVTLKQDNTAPLNAVQEASFDSRGAKIQALVDKLQKHAVSSQLDVNKMILQEAGTTDVSTPLFSKMESLWISNEVYFENASFELVEKLSALPSVGAIREEEVMSVASDRSLQASNATATSVEWGVSIIKATDVWATGVTGQGIVVGGIDTGVRATHEILRGNFRSEFGWFDGTIGQTTPYDDDGHGTHTLGTAVGSNGVGVAPGAQWIGCRGCTRDYCLESWLKACMQFMTCPTDPTGKIKDCSKAPHVVNNSWGSTGGGTGYETALQAWVAAGIIPVFSAGNSGAGGCSTVDSPGDSANAISVGATTITDGLGWFSSKGPSKAGLIKPDITAPGADIRSANYPSDTAYKTILGTSHAAPHVAGVIALMLSANKNLSVNQVRSILSTTTDQRPTLQASGYTCGGTLDTTYPNNQYGAGRVNALKAVLKAKSTTA